MRAGRRPRPARTGVAASVAFSDSADTQCSATLPCTLLAGPFDDEGAIVRISEHASGLRVERERVLDGPIGDHLSDDAGDEAARLAFRREIVSSWRRCQLVGMAPTSEDVP